jgi:tetratricopeptide (TPR) repeat protein
MTEKTKNESTGLWGIKKTVSRKESIRVKAVNLGTQASFLAEKGKLKEAISCYTRAMRSCPENGYHYCVMLCSIYLKLKCPKKTISYANKAIKINSRKRSGWKWISHAYLDMAEDKFKKHQINKGKKYFSLAWKIMKEHNLKGELALALLLAFVYQLKYHRAKCPIKFNQDISASMIKFRKRLHNKAIKRTFSAGR